MPNVTNQLGDPQNYGFDSNLGRFPVLKLNLKYNESLGDPGNDLLDKNLCRFRFKLIISTLYYYSNDRKQDLI